MRAVRRKLAKQVGQTRVTAIQQQIGFHETVPPSAFWTDDRDHGRRPTGEPGHVVRPSRPFDAALREILTAGAALAMQRGVRVIGRGEVALKVDQTCAAPGIVLARLGPPPWAIVRQGREKPVKRLF